jgi:hypothetical protein
MRCVRDHGGQQWRKKSRETFGIGQWLGERREKLFEFAENKGVDLFAAGTIGARAG